MTLAHRLVTDRGFRDGGDDARRLRSLLIESFARSGRWWTWTPDRIEGFLRRCWLNEVPSAPGTPDTWEAELHLWEASGGELVAAVHPEDPDEAWLELHPDWRHLAPQLLDWAEARHRARHADVRPMPPLLTYSESGDLQRRALLHDRGYALVGPVEVLRQRTVAPLPASRTLPPGYRLALVDLAHPRDREELSAITYDVFGVRFGERAMLLSLRWITEQAYLAVVAPDGRYAAWCGVWSVPEIGTGIFEPVGTHPDHRRLGLASAVMTAGLGWMAEHNLRSAFVGTGATMDANRLYASLGFRIAETTSQWRWTPG